MYHYLIRMTFRSQTGTTEGVVQCEIDADSAAQAMRASRDAGRHLGLDVTGVVALSRRRRA